MITKLLSTSSIFTKELNIEIYCHFIWEKLLSKEISTEFVGSNDQLADVLTKSLRGPQIEFIYSKLGTYAPA